MIESPLYVPCPTCDVDAYQRCIDMVTGAPMFDYHSTRTP